MQIGTPAPAPAKPQGREHLPPGVREHERRDANVRIIFWIVLAVIVGAIVTHAALFGFLKGVAFIETGAKPHLPPPGDVQPELPPEPRLQVDEETDLARIREQEQARITSYGWADKQGGAVRIPITRAMELALERGLPKWGDETPRKPGDVRARNAPEQQSRSLNTK